MSGTFKPDQLPNPPGYGYLGGDPLPQTQQTITAPQTPQAADSFMTSNYDQPAVIPDSLRARYGAGDPAMVKSLLLAASGQESGLNGVPPTYAASLLQQFGYPTTMNAWDGNTWDAAIKSHVADSNPLTLLKGY